jgi:hypothetical protein
MFALAGIILALAGFAVRTATMKKERRNFADGCLFGGAVLFMVLLNATWFFV